MEGGRWRIECGDCGCRRFEVKWNYDERHAEIICVGCGREETLGAIRPGDVSAGVHARVAGEAEAGGQEMTVEREP